ncbi:MAG: HipA N-terminal domain-containing protein [Oligoflexus sp.]
MLHVFYEDQLVGLLTRDADLIYSFTYSDAWIKNLKAFPLSIAMPLQKKSFGNKKSVAAI